MRNELRQIQRSVAVSTEDEVDPLLLNRHRRRVRTHQRLLIHTDRGRIKRRRPMLGACKQHHATTRTNRLHGHRDQRIRSDSHKNHIHAASFGSRFCRANHVAASIDRMSQAELRRNRVPLRVKIARQYGRSGPMGKRRQYHSNASLPDDQHGVIRLQIEQPDCLVAGVYGLDKSCLLEWNVIRNLDNSAGRNDPVHHANVLGKAATSGGETSRCPHLLVGLALRESLLAAVEAGATGNVVEGHHSIPNCELRNSGPNRSDGARHLVPEDAWGRVRTGMNFLQVGPANPARINADQQLARTNLRNGNLLSANQIYVPVDGCLHGR